MNSLVLGSRHDFAVLDLLEIGKEAALKPDCERFGVRGSHSVEKTPAQSAMSLSSTNCLAAGSVPLFALEPDTDSLLLGPDGRLPGSVGFAVSAGDRLVLVNSDPSTDGRDECRREASLSVPSGAWPTGRRMRPNPSLTRPRRRLHPNPRPKTTKPTRRLLLRYLKRHCEWTGPPLQRIQRVCVQFCFWILDRFSAAEVNLTAAQFITGRTNGFLRLTGVGGRPGGGVGERKFERSYVSAWVSVLHRYIWIQQSQ